MGKSTTSNWGKSARIADRLRSRIVRGEWLPGSRLPTRIELGKEFRTSGATIQKALDVLLGDRVVESHGRLGTFVSQRPPHRSRVGVVFPCDPARPETWHRMYAAVDDAIRDLVREHDYDLRCYYGAMEADSPGRRQLLDDVAADRLAGVFFMAMPLDCFAGTPLLGHPYLRTAALSSSAEDAGMMPVRTERFTERAARMLTERGCRRLALIYNPAGQRIPEGFAAELERLGLPFDPNWCIPVWPGAPQAARSGAYLLLRQPDGERPDAIAVNDDYLAEQVTLGVLDAGMTAPDDVAVLVQCNFPYLPPAVTPLIRIGYDWTRLVRDVADALLAPDGPRKVVARLLTDDAWRADAEPIPAAAALPFH